LLRLKEIATMLNPIRLYSLDTFDGMYYAVTREDRVVYRSDDMSQAVAYYARLEGIDPATVKGPTNTVEQDLFLAEQLINEVTV
jgi:hypothetical protein